MDKFDETINQAKETVEPSNNFVNETMQQVADGNKPHQRWNIKLWAPILVGIVAILAVILIISPFSSKPAPKKTNSQASNSTTTSSSAPAANTATLPSTVPAAGTDNASLSSDLNSVQGAMNQENTDQSAANNGLNDSQQEVTVPTS